MIKKFLIKYKSISPVVKASFWAVVCSTLQKGISFITVPIFTRIMSPTEYGNVNIFLSWESIISIFATINLFAGVYNVGLSKFNSDADEYTSSLLGLSFFNTIIVFTILFCFLPIINIFFKFPLSYLFLMFGYIIFEPTILFWSQNERFYFRYKKLLFITLLMSILNPVVGLFLIKYVSNIDKSFLRILSIVIVNVLFGAFLFVLLQKKKFCFFSKKYWIFALKFNIPLIPHYLSLVILNSSDRIMISDFCGLDATAFYSVAWSVSYVVSIITSSILLSFAPYSFKKFNKKEYDKVSKISDILLVCVAMTCLSFIALAPDALLFVAPKNYQSAVWVIPPLVGCTFFTFLYGLFANIEFFYEKSFYVMCASVLGAILNIILNFIFIPRFGFIAAGYTSMFCYICFCLAHYVFSKIILRQKNIVPFYNIKMFFVISIVYILVTLILTIFYKIILFRYLFICVLIVIVFINREKYITIIKELKSE